MGEVLSQVGRGSRGGSNEDDGESYQLALFRLHLALLTRSPFGQSDESPDSPPFPYSDCTLARVKHAHVLGLEI
jgi:hypothetical protein